MSSKPVILQVLMSLFNNMTQIEEDVVKMTNSHELFCELKKAGLDESTLENTLLWLEGFAKLNEVDPFDYQKGTIRVFSNVEKVIIPDNGLMILNELYLSGDINAYEFEFVINQIMMLSTQSITIEQFIWVLDMTIANQNRDFMTDDDYGLEYLLNNSLTIH
ncbi:DUF494 family protein [Fastidiosibacter lacustris]|uniref:DUF494 family protein n=1 Tax=Fastidiosibacter lacustris TaxID=2056695 RepID=UPI000E3435A5|nr:DUF494 family protein [Fastidiosibacter lacustris]